MPDFDKEARALYTNGLAESGVLESNGSSPSITEMCEGAQGGSVPPKAPALPWFLEALKTLSPREEKIVKMRLGLEDNIAHTFEEIASHFAVSPERLEQVYRKARRKIRRHIRETLETLDLRPFTGAEARWADDELPGRLEQLK
jgi:hypothetical protein